AVAGDHPVFLGMTGLGVVFARHLDGALDGLGAGIAEERRVGEARLDEALRQLLLAGDLKQIGAVPELLCLVGQRLDQVRMGMAERGDGDAAREIEVFLAIGSEEVGTLAPLERQIVPSIGRQNSWNHGSLSCAKRSKGQAIDKATLSV